MSLMPWEFERALWCREATNPKLRKSDHRLKVLGDAGDLFSLEHWKGDPSTDLKFGVKCIKKPPRPIEREGQGDRVIRV